MTQIIIIEDEVLLAKSLARSLISQGHDCITTTRAEDGLRQIEQMPVDVALVDLQLPGMTGFDAMKKIRQLNPNIAVIVVTAYGTMASVVEAMRSGASDFLRKPIDTEELALAVERAITNARLKQTVDYYHTREVERTDKDILVYNSPGMKKVVDVLEKLAQMELPASSDYPPILILGETGVGKDLIARHIHFRSKFSDKPFVEVNFSNLPKGLEEAELFGYEKGALTGAHRSKRCLIEIADEGTIFLNEIGDFSPDAQAKILHIIENNNLRRVGSIRNKTVDVRIIAATNRNLKDKNLFREDLFQRLNSLAIEIPPLRERKEDIIQLTNLFLEEFCRKYNIQTELTGEAETALCEYNWPGNVRELRHLIERTIFLSASSSIKSEDLNLPLRNKTVLSVNKQSNVEIDSPYNGMALHTIEKQAIIQTLLSSNGNVSEAARKLQIGREALRYRIKKYSISKFVNDLR